MDSTIVLKSSAPSVVLPQPKLAVLPTERLTEAEQTDLRESLGTASFRHGVNEVELRLLNAGKPRVPCHDLQMGLVTESNQPGYDLVISFARGESPKNATPLSPEEFPIRLIENQSSRIVEGTVEANGRLRFAGLGYGRTYSFDFPIGVLATLIPPAGNFREAEASARPA